MLIHARLLVIPPPPKLVDVRRDRPLPVTFPVQVPLQVPIPVPPRIVPPLLPLPIPFPLPPPFPLPRPRLRLRLEPHPTSHPLHPLQTPHHLRTRLDILPHLALADEPLKFRGRARGFEEVSPVDRFERVEEGLFGRV
jgi:hypothetical protein